MLDTSMPPPAPDPAGEADGEPRAAPGGPLAWTATGLLLAAAVLGVVAVFPDYYRGGRPLSAHADEVVQTAVVVLGWLGCAALLARHHPAAAQVGTWAGVGISVAEGGLRLADLGQLTGGSSGAAGLWLLTAAWAAGAVGAAAAVVAARRSGALGRPSPARWSASSPGDRLLGVAVGVAAALSAVAFVPSWDRYLVTSAVDPSYFASVTLGDAFKNPGLAIAGNVVTAAALALLPAAGLLWRPARVGAAVIAGTSVVLAAQVLSGAVQVLETPDPLQLLSPTDVRALQPTISLHLTGWFDAELAALLSIALLGAVRLAAHHHPAPTAPGAAAGSQALAPTWPAVPPAGWAPGRPPGAPQGPGLPGAWAPPAAGGAQAPGGGQWSPPPAGGQWSPPPGPAGPPPPAPPARAGWGPARPATPPPSWGDLPAPNWEQSDEGEHR